MLASWRARGIAFSVATEKRATDARDLPWVIRPILGNVARLDSLIAGFETIGALSVQSS